jgi:AcrR family transcriptional regulator
VGAEQSDALPTIQRIRDAALKSFAQRGIAATTMRSVAASAGVSLGLVQHHFATKAGLVKAVDDYVLQLILTPMAEPIPDAPADSISEIGNRVQRMLVGHPDVTGYLGRALVDGSALGTTIFDDLLTLGKIRWQERAARGETRPDVDLTWAAINSLVLALGAFSLRPHIDRHLPESLSTPEQLHRWQTNVSVLLRDGFFRHPGE